MSVTLAHGRAGLCGRCRWAIPAAAALAALCAVAAEADAPAATGAALDQFLATGVPICMKAPAARCIERGFAFADRDGNGRLSLAEVKQTQAELNHWTKANAKRLPAAERERLVMGLLLLQTLGPEQLFTSFDADGDGELTVAEVTADVRLDQRPLPEILSDPRSVDWDGLAARAGSAAPLLRRLLPP